MAYKTNIAHTGPYSYISGGGEWWYCLNCMKEVGLDTDGYFE